MSTEYEQLAESRRLHYVMSYQVLPEKLFSNRAKLVEKLKSAEGTKYLKILWATTLAEGNFSFMNTKGLRIEINNFKADEIVFITFPQPKRVPECHFVAILKQGDHYRYFTLEVFYNFKELTQVLGEITKSGQHRTYGIEVPAATQEEFLQSIENRLELESKMS